MTTRLLKISTDFSDTPGPRYITEGLYSGQQFRVEILFPKLTEAINNNEKLVVDLDGAEGYGTSFLEESFGGLIRDNHLSYDAILNHLEIISNEEPYLKEDILVYLKAAASDVQAQH
ncbi:MAG: STAS-like domain-containing protein [Alistipes sp.]|nr:STAS-like domain-containing protein [Alistipes sp.]